MQQGPKNSRAQRSSSRELDGYRDLITLWLLTERKTQKEVCDLLKEHPFNIDITVKQLEYRLRCWGVRKNITKAEYQHINKEITNRIMEVQKDTEVTFQDLRVGHKKLQKANQRYGLQSPEFVARMTGSRGSVSNGEILVPSSSAEVKPQTVVRCGTPPLEADLRWARLRALRLDTLPIAEFSQNLPEAIGKYLSKEQQHLDTLLFSSFITQYEIDNVSRLHSRGPLDRFETQMINMAPGDISRQIISLRSNSMHNISGFSELGHLPEMNSIDDRQRLNPIEIYREEGTMIRYSDAQSPKQALKLLQSVVYTMSNNLYDHWETDMIMSFVMENDCFGVIQCLLEQPGETAKAFGEAMLRAALYDYRLPECAWMARRLFEIGVTLPQSEFFELLIDWHTGIKATKLIISHTPEVQWLQLVDDLIRSGPYDTRWIEFTKDTVITVGGYAELSDPWVALIQATFSILDKLMRMNSDASGIESMIRSWLHNDVISLDNIFQWLNEILGLQFSRVLELLLQMPEMRPLIRQQRFLTLAIHCVDLKLVRASIDCGADVNALSPSDSNAPLVTILLLLNSSRISKMTPLARIARYLISHGANVDFRFNPVLADSNRTKPHNALFSKLPAKLQMIENILSFYHPDHSYDRISLLELAIAVQSEKMVDLIVKHMKGPLPNPRLPIFTITASYQRAPLIGLDDQASITEASKTKGFLAGCLWAKRFDIIEEIARSRQIRDQLSDELLFLLRHGFYSNITFEDFEILTERLPLNSAALEAVVTAGLRNNGDESVQATLVVWDVNMALCQRKFKLAETWRRVSKFLRYTSDFAQTLGPDFLNQFSIQIHGPLALARSCWCDIVEDGCEEGQRESFDEFIVQVEERLLQYGVSQVDLFSDYHGFDICIWKECHNCYLLRLQQFIDSGLDINSKNKYGNRILSAQWLYQPAALETLKKVVGMAGASIDAFAYPEPSPLLLAVQFENLAAVEFLLDGRDCKPSIDSPGVVDIRSGPALAIPVWADPDNQWARKYIATPLVLAAALGSLDITVFLLVRGANVNLSVPHSVTALEAAAMSGRRDIVEALLNAGATQAATALERTPAEFTAIRGVLAKHISGASALQARLQ
ncbi:hypothetical protein TWF696_002305 [Orbilia brochopaga]|uniref:Clr5 domain-containing protein n=1 Tax=Orbilia brochopaga TaxID=3140254 RepID=A0AAV9U3Z1_9PEZI